MPIRLETLLTALFPEFDRRRTKVHLAQWNGREHPLDVFYDGDFPEWQADQTRRNFGRDFVLTLIETQRRNIWLFAGLWRRRGEPEWRSPVWRTEIRRAHDERVRRAHDEREWVYNLDPVPETEAIAGRLHVRYEKNARNSYRLYETIGSELVVSSLVETPREFPRFSGYRDVFLGMAQLRRMYADPPEDWFAALSSVGGVYLISDADGAQYVGSAYGEGGFWSRWSEYAATGHGGNVRLIERVGSDPRTGSLGFRFAILETSDTRTGEEEIFARESHWKRVLGSRALGLNAN